jgi:S1-C subfamily serine protease
MAAWPARRSAVGNLASLRFDGTADPVRIPLPQEPPVGTLVLALGADADAAPMARLTVIHSVSVNGPDPTVTLDMPTDLIAEGGPVLDTAGGLLGMAIIGADGEATVIPYASIARMLDPAHAQITAKRGWLGVALQPITVPEAMLDAVGQASGRMVVSLAPSGPAELAGLRRGDILLSVDGHSISGTHALRAFLGPEQIGRQVDVRLLRDGQMETRKLTIAPQPAG